MFRCFKKPLNYGQNKTQQTPLIKATYSRSIMLLIANGYKVSRFMDLCAHSVFVYVVDPLVVLVSVA